MCLSWLVKLALSLEMNGAEFVHSFLLFVIYNLHFVKCLCQVIYVFIRYTTWKPEQDSATIPSDLSGNLSGAHAVVYLSVKKPC